MDSSVQFEYFDAFVRCEWKMSISSNKIVCHDLRNENDCNPFKSFNEIAFSNKRNIIHIHYYEL